MEKGGPTIPLGRQIELEVKLEDGTIFRHPKKEGILPKRKSNRRMCVSVQKTKRDADTGRKVIVTDRRFYYSNAKEHRAALKAAVRFRDGLWAQVAAGKNVEQLRNWARDWEDKETKDAE